MKFITKHYKKILPVIMATILIISICVVGSLAPSANGTGAGLAEWAVKAYKEEWKYVYGGSAPGAVDCSGLIYSYCGGARGGNEQLNTATESGNVSDGIPKIHGLGLYQPGHVGVYVGNGMAIDARDENSNVCYQSTATKSWTKWFKLAAITYPTEGWVKFHGNYYYYESGQYIVNTSRVIEGKTYNFSSSGKSDVPPENIDAKSKKSDKDKSDVKFVLLKLGSKGEDVTKLQNRLIELGFYTGEATGYYGELTESAYKDFQKAAGFAATGVTSEEDFEVFYSDDAPMTDSNDMDKVQLGASGEEVSKIQKKLEKLNYLKTDSTGYYGELTEKAVKEFQKDNSIEVTGVVGDATMDKLNDKDNAKSDVNKKDKKAKSEKKTTKKVAKAKTVKVSKALKKDVESGVKTAKKVVEKTSVISKNALSSATKQSKVATASVVEEKNSNFLMYMLAVLGIAVLVSGFMFALNLRRKKAYSGAHTRTRRKNNTTVRYW